MLLPREALSGNAVLCAVLQRYKTEGATSPAEGARGEAASWTDGGDEYARCADGVVPAAAALSRLAAPLQTAVACVTAQCAEGIATGLLDYL